MKMEDGRVCKNCNLFKPFSELVDKSDCKFGKMPLCKLCKNEKQRVSRKSTRNIHTKRYEKSLKGYLVRTYRNMLSRVKGILKKKAHLYEGLEILDKESFYEWSLNSNYPELLMNYEKSCYDMKLAPSVDRIDSTKGYTLDNIRWITHSENSSLTTSKERLQFTRLVSK